MGFLWRHPHTPTPRLGEDGRGTMGRRGGLGWVCPAGTTAASPEGTSPQAARWGGVGSRPLGSPAAGESWVNTQGTLLCLRPPQGAPLTPCFQWAGPVGWAWCGPGLRLSWLQRAGLSPEGQRGAGPGPVRRGLFPGQGELLSATCWPDAGGRGAVFLLLCFPRGHAGRGAGLSEPRGPRWGRGGSEAE